jgi:hypothetical protein
MIEQLLQLLFGGCDGGPCVKPKTPAAEVRPAPPLPCVKPWVYGETKAQHEAKPCPPAETAPAPEPEKAKQP